MRLLSSHDLSFHKFSQEEDVPPYAILSHTWGPDADEVKFQDINSGSADNKAGYKKIKFCAEQSRQDGLYYFWVDSCCIDQTNMVELQAAINSMFRWYQRAERCYGYLPEFEGVSRHDAGFRDHRWFTRGWTLQELLAPSSVEFYGARKTRLGDRRTLRKEIHDITGIPMRVLEGAPLDAIDSEEKFRWTLNRKTTVPEDEAYCLLGLFGVSMVLMYGEGKKAAVDRLKREIAIAAEVKSKGRAFQHRAPWIVPFERNRFFSGRADMLLKVWSMLFESDYTSRVAVTGLGGVGKTQLVLELLHRRRTELRQCSVIWIPATSKESLEQGYLNAAKKLGIPGYGESKDMDVKSLLCDHLSADEAGQWLLIFDNADDKKMWTEVAPQPGSKRLIDQLPMSTRGSIIFTTRDEKLAVDLVGPDIAYLDEMSEEDGLTLLERLLADKTHVQTQSADATALVARLTYLPLAITQAASYINKNKISIKQYLSLMQSQESKRNYAPQPGFRR